MSPPTSRRSVIVSFNMGLLEEVGILHGVRSYASSHRLDWEVIPLDCTEKWADSLLDRALPQGALIGRFWNDCSIPMAMDYPWINWGIDCYGEQDKLYGNGPVAEAIKAQVLTQAFVPIDETPIPLQNGQKRQLWAAYAAKQVFFHFGVRGAEDLRAVLGESAGQAGSHADPPLVDALDDEGPPVLRRIGWW